MHQAIRQIIIPDNLVFPKKDEGVNLDCSHLAADGVVFIGDDGTTMWVEKEPFTGRITNYDFTEATALWEQAESMLTVQEPEPGPQYKTQFSVLEFRDRFTIDEQLAIRQAQLADMEVGLVYDNFQAAQFIDINDPRVEQGIDLYVAKGLLEPARKQQLLEPALIEP